MSSHNLSLYGRWIAWAVAGSLGLALQALPAEASDTVNLTLTYSERDGLSGPSGQGDLVSGGVRAAAGAAGMMKSFDSLGDTLKDILSGKTVNVPKTTGESMRQYFKPSPALQAAAQFPRSSGYRGKLEAVLEWKEDQGAYVVRSGTWVWTAFNQSHILTDKHHLYSSLSSGGTHKLQTNEVKIKMEEAGMAKSLAFRGQTGGETVYSLKLNIHPKPAAVTGTSGWIVDKGNVYEVKERYTPAGVQTLYTDEYRPNTEGNDMGATTHRGLEKSGPVMFEQGISYHADDRQVQNGRARFSETWTDPNGTQVSISWSVYLPGQVVADPGGPYTVERGGKVTLDGSGSKGKIDSYVWTFSVLEEPSTPKISRKSTGRFGPISWLRPPLAEAAAVPAGPGPGKARKEGEKVDVQPLLDVQATLEAKGEQGSDTATVCVCVQPRDFKTSYDPANDDQGVLPLPSKGKPATVHGRSILPLVAEGHMAFNLCGGEKIERLEDWKKISHVLHVAGDHDDKSDLWEDRAYVLKQVSDPNGPCDGWWYVEKPLYTIQRRHYLSPYFTPDGPPPAEGLQANGESITNWHYENLEWGEKVPHRSQDFDPERCRQDALKHEQEHSRLIKQRLENGGDPGPVIERMCGKDRSKVKQDVYEKLEDADTELHNLGQNLDYQPELYDGFLRLWDTGKRTWRVPVK